MAARNTFETDLGIRMGVTVGRDELAALVSALHERLPQLLQLRARFVKLYE